MAEMMAHAPARDVALPRGIVFISRYKQAGTFLAS